MTEPTSHPALDPPVDPELFLLCVELEGIPYATWVLGRTFECFYQDLRHIQDQAQAKAAREKQPPPGLLDWGKRYLPDHFTKPASRMHRWMAERLDRMQEKRGERLNVLGPRGAAKSTLGTLAYPLRAALEGREPYIWILSDTKQQAQAHLDNIKQELLDNPELARDYPDAVGRGTVWRANSIVLRNGVTIEAYGTGQRIRGRRRRQHRPTLIVCDDLQNDSHIYSPPRRDRARAWFRGTLLKAGSPKTNVVNLATALHREALAMELTETPGWCSKTFRAIDPWPANESLWQAWESIYTNATDPDARQKARTFYDANRAAMNAGASVLWPSVEDLYALMCIRAQEGRAEFEREKQNSPLQPELCEWPESYFDESLWFDQWPENLRVRVLTLDPSKGSDARRGDYSAFIRLGVDRQGLLYIEADLARRPIPQIIADGVEHFRQFRPDAFGVEANQFQDLLADQFESEFRRQGMLGVRPWLVHNDLNKQVRLRRLSPYLAGHKFRMKADSPSTRLLVEQLREFPHAQHDDGPDALEMAVRLAAETLAGHFDDGLGDRLPFG